MKNIVGDADALAPGEMIETKLGPLPVVVIRSKKGDLSAFVDRCLHMGARLSKGALGWHSTSAEDVGDYRIGCGAETVQCPWHGYEFNLETGAAIFDESRKLRSVKVREEDGKLVIEL